VNSANNGASNVSPRLGAPWKALEDKGIGYLSVYFSEQIARWPIREITRRGDNKSDPNVETATYGLFSTCEPGMRNRVVEDGAATIFFVTTHHPGRGRSLTGYYHVDSYTEGTQGAINRDFALAADKVRFVDPIALSSLPSDLQTYASVPFRQIRRTDVSLTLGYRDVIDSEPDRTDRYLSEIARVEQFARALTGLAYPSWGREAGFTWGEAADFYQTDDDLSRVPNSSKSRTWRCTECGYVIKNSALLKKCPLCKETASLVPEGES
jgi:hypothetical protein